MAKSAKSAKAQKEKQVLSPQEAEQVQPDLPAAGFKRTEELAKRTDELAEAAETQANKAEVEAIDPNKIKPDNEILQHMKQDAFSGLTDYYITGLDWENYAYCLVNFRNPRDSPGIMVQRKQTQGWEPVTSNLPEGKNLGLTVEGHRYVGDTVLMRIPRHRKEMLDRSDRDRTNRYHQSVTGALEEAAHRAGVPVHASLDDPVVQRMVQRGQAQQIATKRFGEELRQGSVPGMEMRR